MCMTSFLVGLVIGVGFLNLILLADGHIETRLCQEQSIALSNAKASIEALSLELAKKDISQRLSRPKTSQLGVNANDVSPSSSPRMEQFDFFGDNIQQEIAPA